MIETSAHACQKIGCEVAVSGSCAEGHAPLEACPHYGRPPVEAAAAYDGELAETEGTRADAPVDVLPSGEAFDLDDVDKFLRWRAATFITIMGESHSGKTTFLCALYDRYLRGPFAGLDFAGSRTLVALERRSHYARAESGRMIPDTARTSRRDGLKYFHLALAQGGNPKSRIDLLLSDRSGETYREARNNSTIVATLEELRNPDRLVLLLDGRRVADPLERPGALQGVRQILRLLIDNEALGAQSVVQVVTTKIDLIAVSPERAQIEAALEDFRRRLTATFRQALRDLAFFDVSARDPTGGFAPGHGLERLILDWVAPREAASTAPAPIVEPATEFDRLVLRTKS